MNLSSRAQELTLYVFENWSPEINGVDAQTFRAKYHEDSDLIDSLVGRTIDRNQNSYYVPYYALPLLDADSINQFIDSLERLYSILRRNYISNPKGTTKFSLLQDTFNQDAFRFQKAIRYLYDASIITRYPDNFSDPRVSTHISEGILKRESFRDYLQWRTNEIFDPEQGTKPIKKPGNTEANASKREQLLGAALAVATHFPEQCRRGESIVGKRVYDLILAKAKTWWPDGKVPLGEDTSILLINKWLKTLH